MNQFLSLVLHPGVHILTKISIFPDGLSYVTYTFRKKLWGVQNWNCHFIAVLRRNLEKNSVSYQKSLTFPKIKQFLAYLSKGGGGYPQIFRNMHPTYGFVVHSTKISKIYDVWSPVHFWM